MPTRSRYSWWDSSDPNQDLRRIQAETRVLWRDGRVATEYYTLVFGMTEELRELRRAVRSLNTTAKKYEVVK